MVKFKTFFKSSRHSQIEKFHYSIGSNCKNWFNETRCGAVAIFNLIKQFFLHTADSVVHSFVFALQLIAMYNNKNADIYHEALGS